MKFVRLTAGFCLIFIIRILDVDGYVKIVKISCGSSGKTCDNVFCNVKPKSRTYSTMNFGCDFKRSLKKFYCGFNLHFKSATGQNYRAIYNVSQIEVCSLLKTGLNGPLKESLIWMNVTLKGLVHKCPYQGQFRVWNATFSDEEMADERKRYDKTAIFPNGYYRNRLYCYDDQDNNIGQVIYTTIQQYRNFSIKSFDDF